MFTHGMPAVRLPDDIGGEGSDGVDGDVVGRQRGKTSHRSRLSLQDDEEGGWEMNGMVGACVDCSLISLYDLRESPQIFPRSPPLVASIVSLTPFVHLVTTHACPGVRQVRYARLLFLRVPHHLPRN